MPDDLPDTPAVDVSASTSTSAPGDADVAQNYFDTEISRIHARMDEMQQAMTHMLNSMEMGNAGHSASQSQAWAPASQREPHAAVSAQAGAGRESLSAETEGELEPERSPAPSHWYWRSFLGGR